MKAAAKQIAILTGLSFDNVPDVRINAHTFGDWAAHVRWNYGENDSWSVTHIPSGMALPFFENVSKDEAMETARLLGECRVSISIKDGKACGRGVHMAEAVVATKIQESYPPWLLATNLTTSPATAGEE